MRTIGLSAPADPCLYGVFRSCSLGWLPPWLPRTRRLQGGFSAGEAVRARPDSPDHRGEQARRHGFVAAGPRLSGGVAARAAALLLAAVGCFQDRSRAPVTRPGRRYGWLMSLEWEQVVVAARDPVALGRWWADVLGWVILNDSSDEFEIRP